MSAEIEGFPNYHILSDGRVFNLSTIKFMKISYDKNGYPKITLSHAGIRKTFKIHRLIAYYFIPNPENKPMVDHIDGNPQNNSIENLRWCDNSQNQQNSSAQINNKLGIKNIRLTESGSYQFRKEYQGRTVRKQFKTLEEAIAFKDGFYSALDDTFCRKD